MMYDAMRFWARDVDPRGLVQRLSDVSEVYRVQDDSVSYRGMIGNLRVLVRGNDAFIDGSLAKFHLGNNLHTLTRATTTDAIAALSDALLLPVEQAHVSRCEVGTNVSVVEPIPCYLASFGELSRFNRMNHSGKNGHGITYSNTRRAFTMYDKRAEMKQVPSELGPHILRVELRLLKRVAAQVKRKEVVAADLSEPALYCDLAGRWLATYFAIQRVQYPTLSNDVRLNNVKDVREFFAAIGVSYSGGCEAAVQFVRNQAHKYSLAPRQLRQQVRLIKDLSSLLAYKAEDGRIAELDARIREAAAAHLEQ